MTIVDQKITNFLSQPQPEARRVFHGRGQCYEGFEHLCLDWYSPLLLITAYAPLENPDNLLAKILDADVHQQVQSVMLQERHLPKSPARLLYGVEAGEAIEAKEAKESDRHNKHIVIENGLRFEVNPGKQQNTGLFLDTRILRQWLVDHSADCNVLNLFAYTCSLSVAALAGGASSVTNVDVSKTSIAWGNRNHELNAQDMRRVRAIPHNLFTSWGRVKQYGRYDIVIVDPPTRQRRSFDAEKDYGSVVKKLAKCCHPGARIIAALNSPFLGEDFLLQQFERYLPQAALSERIAVAPEFEESDASKGLKICLFKLPD